ncbi:MAG: NADPH:quinone reductase [Actinoallomurus sp.]|jgi:NADPH:quinone reductase-like Zn-dependent oxidoreductase|nr:NADPH:quinone reductase [Actinoallomurus sp.]
MSQIIVTGIGDPVQNSRLEKDPELTVGADDVLLQMEAAPVNPVDFLFSNGWYGVQPRIPSTIGAEGVGRILEVGSAADPSLIGKRVVVLPTYEQGLWADTAVVPARNVVVVPEAVDASQLSMLAINPVTAYLILNDYVDLEPGEWVGQNLGNSTVARHVIALAKRAGVRTLSVVRSEKAAAEVRAQGGDIVLVDGEDLGDRIADALAGQHLRLVLDGAGGSTAGALAGALEHGGTVVAYGTTTGEVPPVPLGKLVFEDVTVRGFWIRTWVDQTPRAEIERTVAELADLVARGVLSVPVDSTYPIERYEDALARATSPERTGKVLLTFEPVPSRADETEV